MPLSHMTKAQKIIIKMPREKNLSAVFLKLPLSGVTQFIYVGPELCLALQT